MWEKGLVNCSSPIDVLNMHWLDRLQKKVNKSVVEFWDPRSNSTFLHLAGFVLAIFFPGFFGIFGTRMVVVFG